MIHGTGARQKIELSLESFYRSASSLVFQLNKRHITRHMSIFRCIDQRFETGEIFIKWDEAPDEEWLLLIYIKNNSPDEGIVIEPFVPGMTLDRAIKEQPIFKQAIKDDPEVSEVLDLAFKLEGIARI